GPTNNRFTREGETTVVWSQIEDGRDHGGSVSELGPHRASNLGIDQTSCSDQVHRRTSSSGPTVSRRGEDRDARIFECARRRRPFRGTSLGRGPNGRHAGRPNRKIV